MEKTEFKELKDGIVQLQKTVGLIQTDLNAVKTDLNAVKTDLNAVKTDVSGLKSELSGFRTEVNERFTKVDEKLNELDTKQTDTIDLLRIHEDVMRGTDRYVDSVKSLQTQHKHDIVGLTRRMVLTEQKVESFIPKG